MRNRAKCKICSSVIESVTPNDYVTCECGHIGISGGNQKLLVVAVDYANFLRLDDEGKEIEVKVIDKPKDKEEVTMEKAEHEELTREQKIEVVDTMLKYYEDLPQHAMLSPPTQYDLKAIYMLIKQVLT